MKKRRGTARALATIEYEQLLDWSTPKLLGRLKRLRFCEENFETSDITMAEHSDFEQMILFKDSDQWRKAYKDIRTILNTRENVE